VWQAIHEELNDPDFVILSAAQDTGGEAVAGHLFDAAEVDYVQIVDTNHAISRAFNFVKRENFEAIDVPAIDRGSSG
jgi:hypothetical protein